MINDMNSNMDCNHQKIVPPSFPALNLVSNNNLLYVGDYDNEQILVFNLKSKSPFEVWP